MANLDYVLNHFAFNAVAFIRDYWQQKPCVIRQGFIDFQDPISPEELAGLALEPGVDSRVVSQQPSKQGHESVWDLQHGPVEDYTQFGDQAEAAFGCIGNGSVRVNCGHLNWQIDSTNPSDLSGQHQ